MKRQAMCVFIWRYKSEHTPGSSPHPVWKVADSLICHKLQNATVCHSVRVLVGQFEKHWVGDVEPACRGGEIRSKLVLSFLPGAWRTIWYRCLHLLRWSRAEGGIITAKECENNIIYTLKCENNSIYTLNPTESRFLFLNTFKAARCFMRRLHATYL